MEHPEPLTGRDAVEAVGLCVRLASRDARFDGRALVEGLRTRAGRLRVRAGLALAVRVPPPFHVESRPRGRSPRAVRRVQRPSAALAAADRPRPPARAEGGS